MPSIIKKVDFSNILSGYIFEIMELGRLHYNVSILLRHLAYA